MTVNIWISLKQTNKQILKAMKTFLDVQTIAWLKSTLMMMYSCCVICDGWYFGRTHQAPGQTGWCWLELTGPWTRQLTVIKWRPHFERELFCKLQCGSRSWQAPAESLLKCTFYTAAITIRESSNSGIHSSWCLHANCDDLIMCPLTRHPCLQW